MALDTTIGGAAADSYASLTEANAYFTARGVAAWTGSDTVKENALRVATAYLDNTYRDRWVGLTTAQTQALAWPRVDGERNPWRVSLTYPLVDINGFQIADNVIPQQIKNACMQAALLTLGGTVLEPTLARGGQIKSIGKSVGPLRKDIVYMDGAPVLDRYVAIEGLLRGLVMSESNVRIVRA